MVEIYFTVKLVCFAASLAAVLAWMVYYWWDNRR